MKKILWMLLCVPLMFTTCKKEDDTPDYNNGTFLENQDGTVWACQTNDDPYFLNMGAGPAAPQNLLTNIGFYNANDFLCMKSDLLNPLQCIFLSDGDTSFLTDWCGEDMPLLSSIVSQTDNELNIDIVMDGVILMELRYFISSASSNQMNLELVCNDCGDGTGTYNLLYVRSSSTNLSCN